MNRGRRRELRGDERALRPLAYEEAFGCRYRGLPRVIPYSRVVAVVVVAGTLTLLLSLLGVAVWLGILVTLAVSIAGAIVQEHLSRPAPSLSPPSPPADGNGPSGVREPLRPSPRGGPAMGEAASLRPAEP